MAQEPGIASADPQIAGLPVRSNGGAFYQGSTENTSLIMKPWPVEVGPGWGDTQGIAIGNPPMIFDDYQPYMADTEGPQAVYYNGGVYQAPQRTDTMEGAETKGNPIDHVVSPWAGSGPSPYQVDTNVRGPNKGDGEGFTGNTLQPDYIPQGQYGASTGGGTGRHETQTGYYMSQIDQVQRDYVASAFFAST